VSKDKMAKDGMKKEGMGTTGMKKDSMGKERHGQALSRAVGEGRSAVSWLSPLFTSYFSEHEGCRPPKRIAKKSASQGIGKGKRVSFADDLKARARA
jgi:hypothetical protein